MNYSLFWKPRKLLAAVRSKLDQRKTMNQAIRACEQRFGNDPNYRPDLIPACFAPRLGIAQDDSVILKRIIAAYKTAKVDQRNAGEAFNVSNEWLPIYERNLGPVMKALLTEDVGELQRMYENFFRDPCSTGLVGLPINMPNVFFGGTIKEKNTENTSFVMFCIGITYGKSALEMPILPKCSHRLHGRKSLRLHHGGYFCKGRAGIIQHYYRSCNWSIA